MKIRNYSVQLLALLASLALAACGDGGATDPTDDGPTINSFESSANSVNSGSTVTLTWDVSSADTVSIDAAPGGAVLSANTMAQGSVVTGTLTEDTTFTLTATNDEGSTTRSVTVTVNTTNLTPPVINDFSASPGTISFGDNSTLSWNVTGANSIVIRDSGNSEVVNTTNASGTITVSPATSEVYTLTATNNDGSATENASVNVNPLTGAQIVSFTATPATVTFGGMVTLSWSVTDATGGIDISAGGQSLTTSNAATGTFDVTPGATTTYTLTAINPAGDATANAVVTVNPGPPLINQFVANPNPSTINGTTNLSWDTTLADSVRVLRGATEVFAISGSGALSGSFIAGLTDTSTTFILEATNAIGTSNATVMVDVVEPAVILNFNVTPRVLSGATTTSVSWSVENATELELTMDGAPVAGFPVVTSTTPGDYAGSMMVLVSASTTFELIATGPGNTDMRSILVADGLDEIEPNDTATAAQEIPDGGAVTSTLAPGGDTDWYSFTITTPGSSVTIETSDGAGGCAVDTVIRLYDLDGTSVLSANDQGGPGDCSRLEPFNVGTWNMPVGTYFVEVFGFVIGGTPASGPYAITIDIQEPSCGNSIPESEDGEFCDDGNSVAGDGCDLMCQQEVTGNVSGPDSDDTFVDDLAAVGELHFYEIVLTDFAYLTAETWAPEAPDCEDDDTILTLFDSAGNIINGDDDDGVEFCSRIDYLTDNWARLDAGTYYLQVEEFGRNDPIPQYTLHIQTIGVGCGNGIREGLEECDDNNTQDSDGCSSVCAFEGDAENEAGGNNAFNAPGVATASVSGIYSGAIDPAADEDWYEVYVPAGFNLTAYLTTQDFLACTSTSAQLELALYEADGTTLIDSNFNGGPGPEACGGFDPEFNNAVREMTGGTYFLQVSENGADAVESDYFLHISAEAPACGNDIDETGEECDDGNLDAGDRCSPTCEIETINTISAPGGNGPASLTEDDFFQYVRIVTSPGDTVTATAADVGLATCDNISTFLQLFDPFGGNLAFAFDGGPTGAAGNCAAFTVNNVPGGELILVVQTNGSVFGDVEYAVEISPAVCGNGIVESLAGEGCDDGNTAGGDGCDGSCQPEGVVPEVEPNDDTANATDSGLTGAGTVSWFGNISSAADVDYYEFSVPAGPDMTFDARTYTVAGDPLSCDNAVTDTYIELRDAGDLVLISNEDIGAEWCSAVTMSLSTGTYFLRVEQSGFGGPLPTYNVDLTLTP